MDTHISHKHWQCQARHNDRNEHLELCLSNDYWEFVCLLQGCLELYDKDYVRIATFMPEDSNLIFIPQETIVHYHFMQQNQCLRYLRVRFCSTWLHSLCDTPDACVKYSIEHGRRIALAAKVPVRISAGMRSHIQTLVAHREDAFYDRIQMEACLMHLMSYVLPLLRHQCFCNDFQSVKERHFDKIIRAEKIIRENIKEPCTLISLARSVGTNECTLKQGFKAIYGTTVYNYLNNLRMMRALELIEGSDLSIGDISEALGYKNHSNFTVAFKKHYGYTPKKAKNSLVEN